MPQSNPCPPEQPAAIARKALDDAFAVMIDHDIHETICDDDHYFDVGEQQFPDFEPVRQAFEKLAEQGMTHALVRFSDELMRETHGQHAVWEESELADCIDVARRAVIASNMNATKKGAFLHRIKLWKRNLSRQ